MNLRTIKPRPWTCRFGRVGTTTEQVTFATSKIDQVFWACHRSTPSQPLQVVSPDDCERCPSWQLAARYEPPAS
jgi:hypothetical protein